MGRSAVPLVSVLVPARDAAATLATCLASVRRQSERRWECVVVDDGSTDATVDVARMFAGMDDRFKLVGTTGRGLVTALNTGVASCRGRFVARLDADDWMHRDRLRLQLAALGAGGLDAVGCHVRSFPRADLGPGMREYEAWVNAIRSEDDVRREAFVECPVVHPTLTIERPLLAETGYRERGWPEDYDLVLRLLAAGRRIGVVPRRLLGWRHGSGRWSRRSPVYAPARFTACKAEFLASSFLSRVSRYVLWGYGGTGRALAAALRTHGKAPASIVEVHPGRLGNRIAEAEVISPEEMMMPSRFPLIVSVAGAGPRARIRAWLTERGLRELVDFVCAA